ncbi:endonuclease VIII [Romeria aff. gracilis LEGE 07310]|uniref:DNA-(apurinic or apyrimidinic site) lyase n=1 Tax=Vasconcelosia minhoensis LEGE 07310 TaxID=915328 RepID=A0A8J7AAU5_9CYAN|nr:endonuclease VIII [Romeria gracilis]MBE9076094.1 endonuclease VIII [Romeria aff. gracilis LEGE 07310]
MPEGPEIRKAADRVERAIAPYPVSEIFFAFDHLKPYAEKLTGRQIEAVQTHGKAMLIRFDNDLSIYSHNQLYGKWMVRNTYNYPETNRQLRLAIHNEKKSALLYSASDIAVLTPPEVEQHPFLSKLGPDVLDRTLTPQAIQDLLKSRSHQRRQFTTLFLDQHFLAGVGNYLRSEILFVARQHPRRKPVDCSDEELLALGEAAIAVPYQSYQYSGITNDLDLANRLKAEGVSRRQYRHWVFNRDGKPCYVCGTPICKDFASSRRFYYCPVCQSLDD